MQASDYYGYGFWIAKNNEQAFPYIQGQDPGVSFISSYDRSVNRTITIMSNLGQNVWALHKKISATLFEEENAVEK